MLIKLIHVLGVTFIFPFKNALKRGIKGLAKAQIILFLPRIELLINLHQKVLPHKRKQLIVNLFC